MEAYVGCWREVKDETEPEEPMSRGTSVTVQQELAVEQGATTIGRASLTAEISRCWDWIRSSASFKSLLIVATN